MPTEARAASSYAGARLVARGALGRAALAAFLGCLGSVELWGKREQRAAAEAIDTIDHNHWLVAQIQGRPRLEKPPLPRWSIAALMKLTGRRDEWIVRLPGALSGVLTVCSHLRAWDDGWGAARWLWPRRSSFARLGFFVGEMRQASNDGPLVLFTTLALYAAWRRLERRRSRTPRSLERPRQLWYRRTALGSGVSYRAGLGLLDQGPGHPLAGGRDDHSLPRF